MSDMHPSDENIEIVMALLSDREKRIVGALMGIGGTSGLTYSEVSKRFAISEEKVCEIENKVKNYSIHNQVTRRCTSF